MTSLTSFAFPSGSPESTVFFKLSHSSSFNSGGSSGGGGNGGENGGGNNGGPFFPPPPESTPHASSRLPPQFSIASIQPTSTSSSSSDSAAVTPTNTGLLSSTNSPHSSAQSASSKNNDLPLIIGASVGGMVLGALLVTFFFFWRRRRAQRKAARWSQGLEPYTHVQEEERKGSLDVPFDAPTIPATPNAKIVDWMRRNRTVSVSTISSFSSPTVIESVGTRTSISAYSQASALASGTSGDLKAEEDGLTRPPGLYRINE
ncbi:hypothetical protein B0H19DRAFT_1094741 [Mycena capillaripes]|nr:hypothetical protein B0H19DRAFT_1094741 [Mycena capillaripes]